MNHMRAAALGLCVAVVAAGGAAAPVARASVGGRTAVAADGPVLERTGVHSEAEARAVADQALDLASFPTGSVRLADRPPAGLVPTDPIGGEVAHVTLTRWESAPGSVPDVAAWVVAHRPAGTSIVRREGGDAVSLEWFSAGASQALPLSLSAWLAQDGDHVDVTLTAAVVWTPRKTAPETLPVSLRSATLDFRGGIHTFGANSRHLVKGKELARLRTAINALDTAPAGIGGCPANLDDVATLTMSYGGHRVLMQGDKCGETLVTSDGHPQPALNGTAYPVIARLVASATPAPADQVAPAALLSDLFDKGAAQRRATALVRLVSLPSQARDAGPSRPEHVVPNVASRARTITWNGSAAGAVHYLTTHLPRGFVVAHVGPGSSGGTEIILQPAHVYPASSLISAVVKGHGTSVTVRMNGEALWVTPRPPLELIPSGTASARVTILPEQRPSKRIVLTGKALRTLTSILNNRKPTRPVVWCVASLPTQYLKLEVLYHVGKHLVTFYWYNYDCQVQALVDGRRAAYLADPPTALVERLLHWK